MAKVSKVRLLDSGTLVIDQSHITWNIGCGTPVRFPVYSVLVEHPDGLIMFDSGYDIDVVNEYLAFEQPEQTPDQTVPGQLELCGFKPEDVDILVNSHLHFDHCGGNKDLPNATVWMHELEIREARTPEPFERLGYADKTWDHPDAKFNLIQGDLSVADGVHLL
jgi:4-pyridoxolactonase